MEDINKIIKLDILSIRPYYTFKNLVIMLVMGVIYPLISKNVYTVYGVTQVFAILYCSYPFLVGDESGIDALYGAFGIERKKVVYGRYIWSNLVIMACIFIAVIFSTIVSLLIGLPITIKELAYIIPIIFIISNLIIVAQYPFYFKYGYAKSKIIMTSILYVMAILAFILFYFKNFFIDNIEFLINNKHLLISLVLLIVLILNFASIKASTKFYRNRDLI